MQTKTDIAPNRGTPLAAWFILLGALAMVMTSLNRGSGEVHKELAIAGAASMGFMCSIAGLVMGLFSDQRKQGSLAGFFGGWWMGALAGSTVGFSAHLTTTLLGAGALIGFALVVRVLSRRSSLACLMALAAAWSMCPTATVLAAEPVAAKPKVLILGDSISLGYTPLVKAKLADVAEVLRPRENCQHSAYGLKMIDKWIGQQKWDVIHFNWGIWDTHMLDETGALVRDEATAKGQLPLRHTPEQYRENLTSLVKTLKGTGAKLVWASTTPIMRYKGKRYDDLTTLNKVAAEIMKENGIAIDDLYEHTLPNVGTWLGGDKVHFTAVGNEELAKKVSEEIRKALPATK